MAMNFLKIFSKNSNAQSQKNLENEKKLVEICILSVNEAMKKFESNLDGISEEEAEKKLKEYGLNELSTGKKYNIFIDILQRFKNPLVIQLLIICLVSFFMGDIRSAVVVGGMIFLSVFLAFFQERKSNKAAEELRHLVQTSAIVIRDGKEKQIPINEIVPGDIVILAAGSIIPADLRIIFAKDFFVSQSALTGESMPVEKFSESEVKDVKDALSLTNSCFQGSTVISGAAKGIAINTGVNTFLGSISKNLGESKETTSFDKGTKSFVWLMINFMIIMVFITFMIVGITKHNWIDALLFGLSVAVGLTPEMLPMIITVCLSKGAIFMAKKKVIVKKLKAIQNLGAINILCTDKTGTLTQDRVVLEKYVDITNRTSEDVLRYAYMNSYYQTGLRNLLDLSIYSMKNLMLKNRAVKSMKYLLIFQEKECQ